MRLASEVSGDGQLCPLDEIFSCVVRKEGLLKKQGRSAANTPTPRASPSDTVWRIAVFIAPQRPYLWGANSFKSPVANYEND